MKEYLGYDMLSYFGHKITPVFLMNEMDKLVPSHVVLDTINENKDKLD